MSALKPHLAKVASGAALTFDEARDAFDIIMSGDATPGQVGGFLMALRVRGEALDEIAGAVATMREKMVQVEAPTGAIDVVGTGGDNQHSVNISTTSALVVAGAGMPVAKHGNRAASSQTGTADVLAELGVKLDIDAARIARCIREAGIGFMFAQQHHPAMRHVGPTRVELGTRTIFNLLGPLSNPAGVKHHLIGVFAPQWIGAVTETLRTLGSERAWVVHGDGYDEITTTGETTVSVLSGGNIETIQLTPEEYGLSRHTHESLRGGDAKFNAKALRNVLDGAKGAYRDTVLMNAGAALLIAGKVDTLVDGVKLAGDTIDTGKAKQALDRLVAVSNG